MDVNIEPSWKVELSAEFNKPYFKALTSFIKKEYRDHRCFPPALEIFSAFDRCPFYEVKVVIIGQDPYHGVGQANGLCFSVRDGVKHPPSLVNIFKELETDVGKPYPTSGNLEEWASQGVLLLNATLTVRAHEPGSHQRQGWEEFTDAVIDVLSQKRENIIFLLWGGFAKKKGRKIDTQKHVVLNSGHPSPLSANRGYWFGNKHFSQTNDFLVTVNKLPIQW